MKSQFNIIGNVSIYSLPPDFTLEKFNNLENKEKYLVDKGSNLVVTSGLQQILLLMIGSNTESFITCGVGSGNTAAASTDTALETSIGTNAISSRYIIDVTAYFDTFFGKNDENGTWEETGLFNTSSVMLCRRVLDSPFTKSTSNSSVISWSITLTATAD